MLLLEQNRFLSGRKRSAHILFFLLLVKEQSSLSQDYHRFAKQELLDTCSIVAITLYSSHRYYVFTEHVTASDAFAGFASPVSASPALRCMVMLLYGLAFLYPDLESHWMYCAFVVNSTAPYAFKVEACEKFLFYCGMIDSPLMTYQNLLGG